MRVSHLRLRRLIRQSVNARDHGSSARRRSQATHSNGLLPTRRVSRFQLIGQPNVRTSARRAVNGRDHGRACQCDPLSRELTSRTPKDARRLRNVSKRSTNVSTRSRHVISGQRQSGNGRDNCSGGASTCLNRQVIRLFCRIILVACFHRTQVTFRLLNCPLRKVVINVVHLYHSFSE